MRCSVSKLVKWGGGQNDVDWIPGSLVVWLTPMMQNAVLDEMKILSFRKSSTNEFLLNSYLEEQQTARGSKCYSLPSTYFFC